MAKRQYISRVAQEVERFKTETSPATKDQRVLEANKEESAAEVQEEGKTKQNNLKETEDVNTAEEPRKSMALNLLHEINRYMRMQARANGQTIDQYVNSLLEKYAELFEKEDKDDRALRLYEACSRKFFDAKERTTSMIKLKNVDFIKEEAQRAGITMTEFMNGLLKYDMEKKRLPTVRNV